MSASLEISGVADYAVLGDSITYTVSIEVYLGIIECE
jgi:hypothetical protein